MREGCIEINSPKKMNFIDIRAAFDSVCREYIWQALKHHGLPVKYANICQAFYTNTLSVARVGETLTDWFEVASGTSQGTVQAPPLFNIILNWVLEQAIAEKTASQGLILQHRLSSRCPEKHVTDANYAYQIETHVTVLLNYGFTKLIIFNISSIRHF